MITNGRDDRRFDESSLLVPVCSSIGSGSGDGVDAPRSERKWKVAAWVNIVGTLQGSPLADESLLQMENVIGKVDAAGVESLSAARSRQRFAGFCIPRHSFVVNYIDIPFTGSVSMLARGGYWQLRVHGPNDGLSLLADLIAPDAVTLVELGRDHFLLDDQVDVATLALAVTLIRQVEQPSQGILLLPKASGVGSGVGESP